jgi:hypothetical protein
LKATCASTAGRDSDMENTILSYLQTIKKKTVSLGELERLVGGDTDYSDFAAAIINLVQRDILTAVKSSGDNQKSIPLANIYRINHSKIPADHRKEIERFHFHLHPLLKLESYYSLAASEWENDLPYILQIDKFLKERGLPDNEAAAPERSYALVGDEKWIDEKGGKRILERVGLWSDMHIVSLPDPLMLAFNPLAGGEKTSLHLIVENKTTFHNLLDYLKESIFTSLIYGAGWKITADIIMLEKQLGMENQDTIILYFGDLDYEGISIWHSLCNRHPAHPAVAFYRALLEKPAAQGKEYQACNEEALSSFLGYFLPEEQSRIRNILANGGYYPQEALTRAELGAIWRDASWK